MLQFNTIYKNGKPQYFFIKSDKREEFNFIQPYFLATSIDHPRHGRILELNTLFSGAGAVWCGRQQHGYGYSASADVYGELIAIIKKLHGKRLSEKALQELNAINTHEDELTLSAELLEELRTLNGEAISAKYAEV